MYLHKTYLKKTNWGSLNLDLPVSTISFKKLNKLKGESKDGEIDSKLKRKLSQKYLQELTVFTGDSAP